MKRWMLVFLAMAAFACYANAQGKREEDSNARSVRGVVSDSGNNPVSGAVVQLKNTKTLQVRSFISLQDGTYQFHGLNTDVDYELRAEKDSTASGSKTLSQFDTKKTATVNLKLDAKK